MKTLEDLLLENRRRLAACAASAYNARCRRENHMMRIYRTAAIAGVCVVFAAVVLWAIT